MTRLLSVLGLPLLLLLAALTALVQGAVQVQSGNLIELMAGEAGAHLQRVVLDYRLPRVLLGGLVGAHFALAGYLLQLITRNPLADAGVLGISSGSGLAAVIVFVVLGRLMGQDTAYQLVPVTLAWLPWLTLTGGLLAGALLWWLWCRTGLSPVRLAVVGATCAAIFSALLMGALVLWGQATSEVIILWLAGTLYGAGWERLWALLPWSLVLLPLVTLLSRPMLLLSLDAQKTQTLGFNVTRWNGLMLTLAVALAASAVAMSGPVGFVGILVPWLARRLNPNRIVDQLWGCIWLGALLVVAGDTLGRVVMSPFELPVGVVTALIGCPFFLYLLNRKV
ncbi:iron ABC transporter permease [Oceanimonas baumannii]|uniref:FecCD family ABC transporter permease n=1 Tax=Oceanimonas baumannii TaxID=129578 RepID=UPI001D183E6A|nr:iron ABC transporter permease [Oceanimonas baumannii]MCC4265451.1 iron ABC transporter permease [Oceanimonas baumannii]